ncbi:MAG: STAS domain-containing protein [Planctomycetota bacterium]
MAEPFELDQSGDVVTATLHQADVSHHDMQECVQSCIDKLRYDSARDFVFDLQSVEFLASACIGSLVELLQEAEHHRGRISLAHCSENVAFLFKVTKLDAVFSLFDDIDEALAAL